MRPRVIIVAVLVVLMLWIGVAVVCFPPKLRVGRFPPSFALTEKREIVSEAQRDGIRHALAAFRRGHFRLAWRWVCNTRKESVRSVGDQRGGQIHVTFGIDDPTATDGYLICVRYFMAKTNGHWTIVQSF